MTRTRFQGHATAAAAAALALLLTACGGGTAPADEPRVATVTDTSTAQAGSEAAPTTRLVLALPGPVLDLAQPATVHVQLAGTLAVQLQPAAVATAALNLAAPVPTFPGTVPVAAHAPTALAHSVHVALPAGRHTLQARVDVAASSAQAQPVAALALAEATLTWHVSVPPEALP